VLLSYLLVGMHLLLLLLVDLLLQLNNTSLDPGVLEGLFWSHALIWFPLQALVYEFDEEVVLTLHHFSQALSVRDADPSL